MQTYIYLSDIHANIEALEQLKQLPEWNDSTCQFRFGGDYSDGFNLAPQATVKTWQFIKKLCDSNKAKAILGNHDEFIIDAAYKPFKPTWWALNGRENTLKNLGLSFVNESELREQLLYHYFDYMEWLKSLPYVIQDGSNILVHAGFELDMPLDQQNVTTLLWTREAYINATNKMTLDDIHSDYHGKTLISGHTPTINIIQDDNPQMICPIVHENHVLNRYFIDGGSKSGLDLGRINLLKLDENGNKIWSKYVTKEGIFGSN